MSYTKHENLLHILIYRLSLPIYVYVWFYAYGKAALHYVEPHISISLSFVTNLWTTRVLEILQVLLSPGTSLVLRRLAPNSPNELSVLSIYLSNYYWNSFILTSSSVPCSSMRCIFCWCKCACAHTRMGPTRAELLPRIVEIADRKEMLLRISLRGSTPYPAATWSTASILKEPRKRDLKSYVIIYIHRILQYKYIHFFCKFL